jgi:hypothetical protein
MNEMLDPNVWRRRREEMVQEVEQNRLAKVLRAGPKTPGRRVFLLRWESRGVAGLLLKFSKTLKKPRKGARS